MDVSSYSPDDLRQLGTFNDLNSTDITRSHTATPGHVMARRDRYDQWVCLGFLRILETSLARLSRSCAWGTCFQLCACLVGHLLCAFATDIKKYLTRQVLIIGNSSRDRFLHSYDVVSCPAPTQGEDPQLFSSMPRVNTIYFQE